MTIIARYQGPATVVVPGEGRWPAEVALVAEKESSGGLMRWHGQIQTVDDAKWAAVNASPARLELPDGRAGDFMLRGEELSGSGPAPFGDR